MVAAEETIRALVLQNFVWSWREASSFTSNRRRSTQNNYSIDFMLTVFHISIEEVIPVIFDRQHERSGMQILLS